jgi:hypothetical protein
MGFVDEPEDLLGRVRDAFALSLFHSNAALQHGAAALLRGDRSASSTLCDLLHRVVGTSASLGFDAVATRCRALESALQASDERWYAKVFAAIRALDEPCSRLAPVARASMRTGSARSLTLLASDPLELEFDARWPMSKVQLASSCPHPPRGALLVDARRDVTARVRSARGVWGSSPLVAIVPNASEAEVLLALRAGADFVHRDELTGEALRLSAWCALPPPFAHGTVLSLDTDPLRASALRAAIESLGARLVSVEAKAQLQQQFRTLLPHVAVIDASHEEAASVASTIDQQGGSVAIITVGEGRVSWSGERLPEGAPFSALLVACAHALRSTLGSDDVTVAEHGASTQTLKLSRADVRSMINARKEPSKP